MSSGIYCIKNLINNKVYIGSSVNLNGREYKHFWMLKKNKHDNQFLQNSFNKYGENSFVFEVVEECHPELLINLENYHIIKNKSNEISFGYNLALVNEFRRNCYNEEVKIKLSKFNLNKNNNFKSFSLTNIETDEIFIFDNLVEAANCLINRGFANGNPRNIRSKISECLRKKKVNNGYNGSIRKTCYGHKFQIIN
jgi:group I intron endonuclease